MSTTKITDRQAAARRANGKLSNGPTTAAGKAVSSQNALKFGFFAINPLLPGESDAEFAAFRAGWIASLHPADYAEQALVNRIADAAWRLRRFPTVEAGLYTAELLSEQAALTRRHARALLEADLEPAPEEASDPELYRQLQAREREIREELNSPQYALGRVFAGTRSRAAASPGCRTARCCWSAASIARLPSCARNSKRDKTNLPILLTPWDRYILMPMQIRSMPTGSMMIAGARQLLTLAGPATPRRRSQMRQLGLVEDGAVLIHDGVIVATGRTSDVMRMPEARDTPVIDASDKVVMPAFVDSHTHLVFGAPRLTDFEMRISGAKYEAIAKAGGGIASSVRTTRAASTQDLTAQAIYFAQQALATETTTLEVKSGYGLNAETEIRILEVIRDAGQASSAELIPTFLEAHVVPWDMPRTKYISLLTKS
jgi:hypothetical protein